MPEEREINYNIEANLKSVGFGKAAGEVEKARQEMIKLNKAVEESQKVYSGISEKVQKSSRILSKEAQKAYRGMGLSFADMGKTHHDNVAKILMDDREQIKATAKLTKETAAFTDAMKKTSSVVKNTSKSISRMAIGLVTTGVTGLKSMDVLKNLNTAYIQVGASALKFGIGLNEVVSMSNRAIKTMGLTSQEALQLFDTFQKGFVGVSTLGVAGFEKLAAKIRNVVGPDLQAMNAGLGEINTIVQKFPGLATVFENVGDPAANKR